MPNADADFTLLPQRLGFFQSDESFRDGFALEDAQTLAVLQLSLVTALKHHKAQPCIERVRKTLT